jgi:hypothetical protein
MCVVLVAACGGKKDEASGGAAAAADGPTFTTGTLDVAGANALVPAALKDKIVFEKRAIPVKRGHRTSTYTVAAPVGWKQGMDAFANLKADDKGGFFSEFDVGTNCDGSCEEKDWDKVTDKATFQPIAAHAKVLKDVKGAGTREMIAQDPDNTKVTTIAFAWWKKGDNKYYQCRATLDPAVADAAPAFEKACSALTLDGDD